MLAKGELALSEDWKLEPSVECYYALFIKGKCNHCGSDTEGN